MSASLVGSEMCIRDSTWRGPGQAKRLHQQYIERHGRARADEVAGRLPPHLLRGRWGSKDAVEK
eukprot:14938339-Alexandrium_andersonii.AAC.1